MKTTILQKASLLTIGLFSIILTSSFIQHNGKHNSKGNKTTNLPTQKYFKVIEVTKNTFLKGVEIGNDECTTTFSTNGDAFLFQCKIKNISQFTFDQYSLDATIIYKWKEPYDNGKGIQYNLKSKTTNISPAPLGYNMCYDHRKILYPDSTLTVYIKACSFHDSTCYKMNMDAINLTLNIEARSSKMNNFMINGAYAKYDILDKWKQKQTSVK